MKSGPGKWAVFALAARSRQNRAVGSIDNGELWRRYRTRTRESATDIGSKLARRPPNRTEQLPRPPVSGATNGLEKSRLVRTDESVLLIGKDPGTAIVEVKKQVEFDIESVLSAVSIALEAEGLELRRDSQGNIGSECQRQFVFV